MPETMTAIRLSPAQQKLDQRLLLSLALSPVAAGISTIVGYTVAHHIVLVAYKGTGYIVSASAFCLCAVAAVLAWSARRKLLANDGTAPLGPRQLFMAQLALSLAGLCALLVLAGFLVLMILQPGD